MAQHDCALLPCGEWLIKNTKFSSLHTSRDLEVKREASYEAQSFQKSTPQATCHTEPDRHNDGEMSAFAFTSSTACSRCPEGATMFAGNESQWINIDDAENEMPETEPTPTMYAWCPSGTTRSVGGDPLHSVEHERGRGIPRQCALCQEAILPNQIERKCEHCDFSFHEVHYRMHKTQRPCPIRREGQHPKMDNTANITGNIKNPRISRPLCVDHRTDDNDATSSSRTSPSTTRSRCPSSTTARAGGDSLRISVDAGKQDVEKTSSTARRRCSTGTIRYAGGDSQHPSSSSTVEQLQGYQSQISEESGANSSSSKASDINGSTTSQYLEAINVQLRQQRLRVNYLKSKFDRKCQKLRNEITIKDARFKDLQDRVVEANGRDKARCGLGDTMRTKIEDQMGITEGDTHLGQIKSTHCEDDRDV